MQPVGPGIGGRDVRSGPQAVQETVVRPKNPLSRDDRSGSARADPAIFPTPLRQVVWTWQTCMTFVIRTLALLNDNRITLSGVLEQPLQDVPGTALHEYLCLN
jgi:hypothetical protein